MHSLEQVLRNRSLLTANPGDAVLDVIQRMTAARVGAVTILDGERLVGVFSERDLMTRVVVEGRDAAATRVDQVMTREVVTCGEHTPVDEIMELMTKGRFRHLPVIEDNSLVGIVSIGDIVKHHIAEVELEVSAMRGYFATG